MKAQGTPTTPHTPPTKFAAVTAVLITFIACLHVSAQNNPFKIKDNLHAEYQRLFAVMSDPKVLDGAERLYRQAIAEGDSKAACIALTLPLGHYYYAQNTPLATFDKSAERLKGEALRTGYLQYYFYASAQRATVLIYRKMYLLATQTAKKHKEDAERLNNDYGRYTFIRCMAKIHQEQDDMQKATEYLIMAYNFAKEKKMEQDMAPLCNYIATTYMEQGNTEKATEWNDRALECIINKNNIFNLIRTKLKLLFSAGKSEEFLAFYKKHEEEIMKRKNTMNWYSIEARRLCCEGRHDEALKMVSEQGKGEEEWLKLKYDIAIKHGDYKDAVTYQRKYYEWFARQYVGLSDAQSMSELDAMVETERLNIERLKLEYANAASLLRNSETGKELRLHETDNMRMRHANDSAAIAQLKLDSTIAAKRHAANVLKDKTSKAIAKRKQTTEIFVAVTALLLLISAIVAVALSRKRIKATRQHNAELSEALARARQTQKMQDSFINNMSLEVREPLKDIVENSSRLLENQERLTHESKTDISDRIGQSAEKLAELVNSMLKKALEESTGKAAKATVMLALAILTATTAMGSATHDEVKRLLGEKRTLRALYTALEEYRNATDAKNREEQYAWACDIAAIYKSRTNTNRSIEYAEKALDTWRKHKTGASPADIMLLLGEQYRKFYKLDMAADILSEAARHCTTSAQRLKLHKETANIAFERDDSASFMAEYATVRDLERTKGVRLDEKDRAVMEAERLFFINRNCKALDDYENILTSRHSQILRTTMLTHMRQWDLASKALADAMRKSRAARASIYESDRKEMEDEADNRQLEANNTKLQLEHARLQLEEHNNMLQLEERRAEQLRLQMKKDELSRNKIAAGTSLILAKLTMDKRRTEETDAQNKLSDIRTAATGGVAAIVAIMMTAYLIAYRKNLKAAKAKNRELDLALKEAERAEKEKNAFIQNISHEIRTPLNAIMGFSQIMSASGEGLSDEERTIFSTTISKNADLLSEIVYDIIDSSELENGKKEIAMEEVCPQQLCAKATDAVKHRVKDNVPIVYSTTIDNGFTLSTNGGYVSKILTHFLTNAIKYTEEGKIVIGCNLDEHKGNVCFYVEDTGCGIPSDKREAIFNRFFKIDTFKQGTGLGLNICKRLAERLNARIMVDPEYDNGARFLLIVPVI